MGSTPVATIPAVPVPAGVGPWAITDEDVFGINAAILRHDFTPRVDDAGITYSRRVEYLLPRRALAVDFDGNQASVNVDRAAVVRWETFEDHVKADVVFTAKPAALELWFAVNFVGLSPVDLEGDITLIDPATGQLVGLLSRPFLRDSVGDRHDLNWTLGDGCITAVLPDLDDHLWVGAVFDPTTIDTSTSAAPTGYGNQKTITRLSTGMLVAVFSSTGSNAEFWRSSDNGATWTQYTSGTTDIPGWVHGSISPIVIGATEYLAAVFKQGGTGGGRTDTITYYAIGAFNAGRTTLAWSTIAFVFSGADGSFNYPDVLCAAEGTGAVAHVVSGYAGAGPFYKPITLDSSGAPTLGSAVVLGGVTVGFGRPSIDMNRATKDLGVTWADGASGSGKGIRFKKATYSAGAWTWGAERELDNTRYIDADARWLRCLYDGTRFVIVGEVYTGTQYDLVAHERDAGDTATTTRALLTALSTANRLDFGSATYDSLGNLFIFGVNQDEASGSKDLVYRKWTRSGASLGAEVVVDASVGDAYVSAKVGYANQTVDAIYRDLDASPYNINFTSISLNTAPTASPWVTTAGAKDVAASLALDWDMADPESDAQGAYALKRDIGGTITYYRASDATWQVGEVKNSSAATIVTLASGWGLDADANHNYYVKTWDSPGDLEGVYSSALVITPSAKANPTIDLPVDAGTVPASSYDATWTVAQQSEYLLELLNAAGTTVLWTAGGVAGAYVVDASARRRTIGFTLVNGTAYKLRLTTKNTEGLVSNPDVNSFTASFTPPATATVALNAVDDPGHIIVTITNPAPSGSQPAVAHNELYRRTVGDTDAGVRVADTVANNGNYTDELVGHYEDLEYRALVVGANGTTSFSAWTS